MTREQEFKEFLDANVRIVYKVCRLYSNTEEEFRDFVQEVVLQMWRSFKSFRGDAKPSTWVYRVALNVCLSQLKLKERKLSLRPLEEGYHDTVDELYDDTYDERARLLYTAIKKLKEVDRALILLYLEDKSYEEIAGIMGISLSNTGVKINRIKKQLSKIIHGK